MRLDEPLDLVKISPGLWRLRMHADSWLWMGIANGCCVQAETTAPDAVAAVRGTIWGATVGAELVDASGRRVKWSGGVVF